MHKVQSILPRKILYWYDKNKRHLPWRIKSSQKRKEYYTLVSEFMLQQTKVKTVVPYFKNFVKNFPNLRSLSRVNENKLFKNWQGLGYYSRAKNLKKTAEIIVNKYKNKLPNNLSELKKLPGIGEYTASALMAIAFNKPIIPLDGNVERVLIRVLNLKTEKEIAKENLMKKRFFFGNAVRSSDYAQAIMEIGALICKPKNPLCHQCPLITNCLSFKKKDFEIKPKIKKEKNKFFEVKYCENKNKVLLIKNEEYTFLKNLLIFPMSEISKKNFSKNLKKVTNIKMSNMNMKIKVNYIKSFKKNYKIQWVYKFKLEKYILPSFTKKIYKSIQDQI